MKEQQKISKENLKSKIGKVYDVIIENTSFDNKYFVGRTMQDVPDIDGLVYIEKNSSNEGMDILNKFVKCEIIEISDYDLLGKIKKVRSK